MVPLGVQSVGVLLLIGRVAVRVAWSALRQARSALRSALCACVVGVTGLVWPWQPREQSNVG